MSISNNYNQKKKKKKKKSEILAIIWNVYGTKLIEMSYIHNI